MTATITPSQIQALISTRRAAKPLSRKEIIKKYSLDTRSPVLHNITAEIDHIAYAK